MMAEFLFDFFQRYDPVVMALIATLFTWFVTAAGAVPVLFVRRVNQKAMDGMLGMAAGVMIAASFWSLLAPAIEMSGGDWVPAVVGFTVRSR
jgi:ZIP family zinc transporter